MSYPCWTVQTRSYLQYWVLRRECPTPAGRLRSDESPAKNLMSHLRSLGCLDGKLCRLNRKNLRHLEQNKRQMQTGSEYKLGQGASLRGAKTLNHLTLNWVSKRCQWINKFFVLKMFVIWRSFTEGIWILDMSRIHMAETCSDVKWSIFRMVRLAK